MSDKKDGVQRKESDECVRIGFLVSVIVMAVFVGIRNKDNTLRGIIEYCLMYLTLKLIFTYFG